MTMINCLGFRPLPALSARPKLTGSSHFPQQLKLHGHRALSEGLQGSSCSTPNSEFESSQDLRLSMMENELEKLRVEMRKMQIELSSVECGKKFNQVEQGFHVSSDQTRATSKSAGMSWGLNVGIFISPRWLIRLCWCSFCSVTWLLCPPRLFLLFVCLFCFFCDFQR